MSNIPAAASQVKWAKTLLVVSHAREFLNAVTTDTIHLHSKKLAMYKGAGPQAEPQPPPTLYSCLKCDGCALVPMFRMVVETTVGTAQTRCEIRDWSSSCAGNYSVFEKTAAERLRNAKSKIEAQDAHRKHVQVRPLRRSPTARHFAGRRRPQALCGIE